MVVSYQKAIRHKHDQQTFLSRKKFNRERSTDPNLKILVSSHIMKKLTNKIALVTGSTSGIGLATAHVLAANGANVILHGLLSTEQGDQLAEQFIAQYQIKAVFNNADLRSEIAIAEMFSVLNSTVGTVDILVNNAGIQHTARLEDFASEHWQAILDINLTAAFHTMHRCIAAMQSKAWGRIINIASVHGLVASVNKSAYVAAKHGLVGLTKVVALENASAGITVNAICPGWVETPLINQQINDLAQREKLTHEQAKTQLITAKQPLPEMVNATHIGELVLFLCSDAASAITGAALPIDGAWTAQ